ncbi:MULTISPECIES: glycine cleavage system protein GcvH [Photobacterium]|uniref:Glycine cleavage system H protein n=1 Tax=Photobacterium halotolerans TaxID=265726 RepID=A0A0F5V812_9GAMM|nr:MULTISPECIES: glycine cleavage system protein GcvH [Photobacterium]KKC98222.1 glycine cleavage system protein H [Photobacterium halotolerans]UIP28404.1 glycine cleavage system protein GcvH [Photobacterium sp. TLY01]
MAHVPSELKYTESHEWVRPEGDGVYTIGITDHAQQLLGDMVFVDLPEVDRAVSAGDEFAVAESVKAVSEVYAPLSGVVVAINEELEMSPELLNHDPYGDGWLVQIKADDEAELDELLDANAYTELAREEED